MRGVSESTTSFLTPNYILFWKRLLLQAEIISCQKKRKVGQTHPELFSNYVTTDTGALLWPTLKPTTLKYMIRLLG